MSPCRNGDSDIEQQGTEEGVRAQPGKQWTATGGSSSRGARHLGATGFRMNEDAHGYSMVIHYLVMQDVALTLGRPLAVYHDRHSIFRKLPNEKLSVQEQLAGKATPTQFGRMLEELQIESIAAYSPQAKGRVERLFGAGQDRLVSELRLAGATTIEAANQVLERFPPEYNQRFAVAAAETGSAYRPLPQGVKPEEVFCFKIVDGHRLSHSGYGQHCAAGRAPAADPAWSQAAQLRQGTINHHPLMRYTSDSMAAWLCTTRGSR